MNYLLYIALTVVLNQAIGFQRKPHVQVVAVFDRPLYASGDTMRCQLTIPHLFNEKLRSRLVIAGLADLQGNVITRNWTPMDRGLAQVSFNLADSVFHRTRVIFVTIQDDEFRSHTAVITLAAGENFIAIPEREVALNKLPIEIRIPESPGIREHVTVETIADENFRSDNYVVSVYNKSILGPGPVVAIADFESTGADSEFRSNHAPMAIKGKVVLSATGEPVPDSTRITFFFRSSIQSADAFVQRDGKFKVTLLQPVVGRDLLYYQINHKGRTFDADIRLDESLPPVKTSAPQYTTIPERFVEYNAVRRALHSSYFSPASDADNTIVYGDLFQNEVGEADQTVNPNEFVPFASMKEMIREVIPLVQARGRDDSPSVRIYFREKQRTADGDPLYIIDGMLTSDTKTFLAINPSEVEQISVYYSPALLARIGSLGRNGVIVVTRKPLYRGMRVPMQIKKVLFDGLLEITDPNTTFGKAIRVPDLRPVLCWRSISNGTIGDRFTFTTSDDPGMYVITITSVGFDGTVSQASREFSARVKY